MPVACIADGADRMDAWNTGPMLRHDEALGSAALELAHESELFGVEVVAGMGLESPGFWVFYPNSVRAFATELSADSLSHRIPPLVVDRRSGRVTRPVAAGLRVSAADLGPREWFILQPSRRIRARTGLADGDFSAADAPRIEKLEHFEFRRGERGDGDVLEARLVAVSPQSIAPGLQQAGLVKAAHGWTMGGSSYIEAVVVAEFAVIQLRIAGNGEGASAWTVSSHDIAIAERIESALAGADWVRFWD